MALHSAEISVFDSRTGSSFAELLPNVSFDRSIRPEIAGSSSFGNMESRLEPKPEVHQGHFGRARGRMRAFSVR
jgi:hypothetical protein